MQLPRYWSKATAKDNNRDGQEISISCWRASDAGQNEPKQSALEAAQRALSHLLRR